MQKRIFLHFLLKSIDHCHCFKYDYKSVQTQATNGWERIGSYHIKKHCPFGEEPTQFYIYIIQSKENAVMILVFSVCMYMLGSITLIKLNSLTFKNRNFPSLTVLLRNLKF